MNFNINIISRTTVTFLKDQVLPALNETQKKIAFVVAFAFSCLVLLFLYKRYFPKADRVVNQKNDQASIKSDAVAKKSIGSHITLPEQTAKVVDDASSAKKRGEDYMDKMSEEVFTRLSDADDSLALGTVRGDSVAEKAAREAHAKYLRNYSETHRISLREFRDMDVPSRQQLIDKFELQSNIASIGKDLFFLKLSQQSNRVLELVNLSDVEVVFEQSKIKYAFLSDDEFEELTLDQIKDASQGQKRFIYHRNTFIKTERDVNFVCPKNILDLNLAQFTSLSAKKINDVITEIPPSIFSILSDAHLTGLEISRATTEQIKCLFSWGSTEDKRRFALLPADQVNDVLTKLDGYQMYLLSDEHLKRADVSKLTEDQLKLLFSCKQGTTEDKRRFALLPSSQVNDVLAKLDGNQMYLLTDDHLKQADVSKLTEDQLKLLFSCKQGTTEDKRRFAFLPSSQVNGVLAKLDGNQMYLLTDDHLKKADVSKLTEEQLKLLFSCKQGTHEDKRRFALLPSSQVNGVLAKLDGNQMYLLTDDHLKQADVSKLTEEQLKLLFSCKQGTHEDKRRFALLPSSLVKSILDKLEDAYQMYLISDKQLKSMDVTQISDAAKKLMFTGKMGTTEDRRRLALMKNSHAYTI